MSTHHSADMTPSDSSELLNAEEAEQQALAERVFSVIRKPMSTPRYIALLIGIVLVVGLGGWGIVRGVEALVKDSEQPVQITNENPVNNGNDNTVNNPEEKPGGNAEKKPAEGADKAKEDRVIANFGAPDPSGVMHVSVALPSIKHNRENVEVALPSDTLEHNYALHVYAPASTLNKDAYCSLRFETSIFDKVSNKTTNSLVTPNLCPTSTDGSVDIWLPVTRTDWIYDNRFSKFIVRGWGVTLDFDLMKLENASPNNWDGTSPFQGTGPAFIHTTSDAYAFSFHSDKGFAGVAYASQRLDVFEDLHLNTKDGAYDSILYTDGTSEPSPGYIFLVPSNGYMDVSWVLEEIDTGDLPDRQ
ncbi:MAG: hypothetical protein IKS49_00285 [Actinomycetaceae bacterium]|nr:hypothetical protein [Actinomycetaceae bacterium]